MRRKSIPQLSSFATPSTRCRPSISRRHFSATLGFIAGITLAGALNPPGLAQSEVNAGDDQEPATTVEPSSTPAESAAATTPIFELDPIIITATRTAKPLFEIPAVANIVTAQNIAEAGYRTLPEALRAIPGVMVQKTGHGQGSPFIRGFTGFRNLLLIDGIRLNNSVFRDGPNQYWNTIDPYSISRLELVKGPSSVLYGSDAIGGTVNVITKSPDTYSTGFQFGGRGFYRFSSAERSNTFRAEVSTTWEQTLGFFAGGTSRNYGDLESAAGRQPLTGYRDRAGDFKFEYFFNPDTRLVFAHQRTDLDDAWRTHKTIFGRRFEGTTVGNELRRSLDQNRELTYAQFHAENIDSFIDTARISISYQSQAEERDRVRSDGRRDLQGFAAETVGIWAQFESVTDLGRWTSGIEYYRDNVDSFRRDYNADGSLDSVRIQGPVGDDATYDLFGIYLQNDIPINDSLDIILGGRFTSTQAEAGRVEDPATGNPISITEDFEAFVGSARFLYRLDQSEHWNLFGGISQGFRAPNLSDLTRFDSARSNEIETPAPGLDPERFISYEIGTKVNYENLFAQASYFYTDIDEMIIRQPTGVIIDGENEITKRNSGSGFIQGLELETNWRFHHNFAAFSALTWLEGEVDTFPTSAPVLVREPLSRLMPATGQFGVRWDAPERDLWLETLLTIAERQDRLSSRDRADTQRIPPGGTPGYTVLSLRGGWEINHNFSVTAALDNLTNQNYRIHGSGINEPGINFILGLQYRF